jgi:hypothetical protein
MPIVDNILNELSFESPVTARVLERVPLEKSDWKPHERSMSLGALAWHLAGIPARSQRSSAISTRCARICSR